MPSRLRSLASTGAICIDLIVVHRKLNYEYYLGVQQQPEESAWGLGQVIEPFTWASVLIELVAAIYSIIRWEALKEKTGQDANTSQDATLTHNAS
jgi:hypothetical protein